MFMGLCTNVLIDSEEGVGQYILVSEDVCRLVISLVPFSNMLTQDLVLSGGQNSSIYLLK